MQRGGRRAPAGPLGTASTYVESLSERYRKSSWNRFHFPPLATRERQSKTQWMGDIHYSAAGASAAHGRITWLDGDDRTTDDLSNTVAADATDTLGAGKGIFEQPGPTTRCTVDFQQIRFAAERG